jgi:hypothetical protein
VHFEIAACARHLPRYPRRVGHLKRASSRALLAIALWHSTLGKIEPSDGIFELFGGMRAIGFSGRQGACHC